jgi:triosephosphate isomerase
MRDQIVAGNWKMNKNLDQGLALVAEIQQFMLERSATADVVILAPPFIHLASMVQTVTQTNGLHLSAQNCHQEEAGAYTGEVSASMLRSLGVEYVILGHSERREYFSESNQLLAAKVKAALNQDLKPIFCCGEPLSIRESNQQEAFVNQQLSESLFDLPAESIAKIVLAYEPIWAIGTGKTASAEQAQEMHASIRAHLEQQYGQEVSQGISILYGGSCKPSNAREIFAGEDVDGGLIGGASLNAADFMAIANSFE